MSAITHEEYMQKVRDKNPNIILLNKYAGSHSYIDCKCIICNNEWSTIATALVRKHSSGCPKCNAIKGQQSRIKNNEEWLNSIRNDKINILGTYTGLNRRILVECKKCKKQWSMLPMNIKRGQGCSDCEYKNKAENYTISEEEFDDRLNKEHHNEIKRISNFNGLNRMVDFHCNICGYEWTTTGNSVINACKTGCPSCHQSKNEKSIKYYLEEKELDYEIEFTKHNCYSSGGKKSQFDFFIANTGLIEVDGEQHFFPVSDWDFEKCQKDDSIKTKYCENNNIPLLRIKYTQVQSGEYKSMIDDFIANPKKYIYNHNTYLSTKEYYME